VGPWCAAYGILVASWLGWSRVSGPATLDPNDTVLGVAPLTASATGEGVCSTGVTIAPAVVETCLSYLQQSLVVALGAIGPILSWLVCLGLAR